MFRFPQLLDLPIQNAISKQGPVDGVEPRKIRDISKAMVSDARAGFDVKTGIVTLNINIENVKETDRARLKTAIENGVKTYPGWKSPRPKSRCTLEFVSLDGPLLPMPTAPARAFPKKPPTEAVALPPMTHAQARALAKIEAPRSLIKSLTPETTGPQVGFEFELPAVLVEFFVKPTAGALVQKAQLDYDMVIASSAGSHITGLPALKLACEHEKGTEACIEMVFGPVVTNEFNAERVVCVKDAFIEALKQSRIQAHGERNFEHLDKAIELFNAEIAKYPGNALADYRLTQKKTIAKMGEDGISTGETLEGSFRIKTIPADIQLASQSNIELPFSCVGKLHSTVFERFIRKRDAEKAEFAKAKHEANELVDAFFMESARAYPMSQVTPGPPPDDPTLANLRSMFTLYIFIQAVVNVEKLDVQPGEKPEEGTGVKDHFDLLPKLGTEDVIRTILNERDRKILFDKVTGVKGGGGEPNYGPRNPLFRRLTECIQATANSSVDPGRFARMNQKVQRSCKALGWDLADYLATVHESVFRPCNYDDNIALMKFLGPAGDRPDLALRRRRHLNIRYGVTHPGHSELETYLHGVCFLDPDLTLTATPTGKPVQPRPYNGDFLFVAELRHTSDSVNQNLRSSNSHSRNSEVKRLVSAQSGK